MSDDRIRWALRVVAERDAAAWSPDVPVARARLDRLRRQRTVRRRAGLAGGAAFGLLAAVVVPGVGRLLADRPGPGGQLLRPDDQPAPPSPQAGPLAPADVPGPSGPAGWPGGPVTGPTPVPAPDPAPEPAPTSGPVSEPPEEPSPSPSSTPREVSLTPDDNGKTVTIAVGDRLDLLWVDETPYHWSLPTTSDEAIVERTSAERNSAADGTMRWVTAYFKAFSVGEVHIRAVERSDLCEGAPENDEDCTLVRDTVDITVVVVAELSPSPSPEA